MKGLQVYMNNPLTYRGETFYQSSVIGADQGTVFQVVRNPGWMLPYLSCIMVGLGMLFHFGINLMAFLSRLLGQATQTPGAPLAGPISLGGKPRLVRD